MTFGAQLYQKKHTPTHPHTPTPTPTPIPACMAALRAPVRILTHHDPRCCYCHDRYRDAVWMMHATAAAKTFDGLGLLCFQMVVSLLVTSWTSQAGFFNPVEIFSNSVSAYYCLLALLMMARQKHGSTLAARLSVRSVKAVKVAKVDCIYSVFSVVFSRLHSLCLFKTFKKFKRFKTFTSSPLFSSVSSG